MYFMSRISNMARQLAGRPTAAPSIPTPVISSIPGGRLATFAGAGTPAKEGDSAPPKIASVRAILDLSAFQKLGIQCLGQDAFIRSKNGLQLNKRYPISQQLIDKILDAEEAANGPIYSEQDIDDEKKNLLIWGMCEDRLSRYSFVNIGKEFRKQIDSFSAALLKGENPTPPQMLDRASMEQSIPTLRAGVRQAMATICQQVYSRISPKCEKLRDRAQIMTLERYTLETEEAQKSGVAFKPSTVLEAFFFFALKDWSSPIDNFLPWPIANLPPCNIFFGRVLFPWKASEEALRGQAESREATEAIDRLIADQKQAIARRQKNELAATSAAHAATTAKLSELHDKLRVSCQADADKADAERQARRPVQNVRIVQ